VVFPFNHLPVYILPGPLVVATACSASGFRRLLNSLLITTEEAAGGLAASIVVGVAVAMVFAQWRWLRQLVYPYTILLQTVPIVAIAPLIILWAGAGFFRRHDCDIHHLPCTDHRQYYAGIDQRG
jgi:NitT/TauT family transport system permease protein